MTEQEAEAWLKRLTRVWASQEVVGDVTAFDGECLFYAQVKPDIYVQVDKSGEIILYSHVLALYLLFPMDS